MLGKIKTCRVKLVMHLNKNQTFTLNYKTNLTFNVNV